jgi:hypothetical protein
VGVGRPASVAVEPAYALLVMTAICTVFIKESKLLGISEPPHGAGCLSLFIAIAPACPVGESYPSWWSLVLHCQILLLSHFSPYLICHGTIRSSPHALLPLPFWWLAPRPGRRCAAMPGACRYCKLLGPNGQGRGCGMTLAFGHVLRHRRSGRSAARVCRPDGSCQKTRLWIHSPRRGPAFLAANVSERGDRRVDQALAYGSCPQP